MINNFTFEQYRTFIWCWIALALVAGIYLLKQDAPYGRFSSTKWGPMISNRTGWLIMEATVLVTFYCWLPPGSVNWTSPAGVMILLFTVHYINRSFIFPFRIRTKGKKMPVAIMLSAIVFNTVNGSLLGCWFARWAAYPSGWFYSPAFLLGTSLFITGMSINWWADHQLIQLRGKGDTGYKIPEKGLFQYLTSPNLSGEMLEWAGFAILTWSLPGLAFAVWTCANLVPRAISNHRWYRQQFAGYPVERKILLPFIW
jgi:protein-S-isoprenylcysteine O-methyltransferase Ste14